MIIIDVAAFNRPGLGMSPDMGKAEKHLREGDKGFFDE